MALRKKEFTGIPYYTEGSYNGLAKNSEPTKELLEYWELLKLDYGSARRKRFLALLETGFQFRVNAKHCCSMTKDPDLKKLLKQKKIEMYTVRGSMHNYMKCTYIKKV